MGILTFGEPLLINYLESPKLKSVCDSYFSLGGSEINTMVTLRDLKKKTFLISAFPNNKLGLEFFDVLKKIGIDTEFCKLSQDDLIGSVYVKNNEVIFQRKHSSFSKLKYSEVNFDIIFNNNYDWVHFTGITPMLSKESEKIWIRLLEESINRKIKSSIDFNFRPKLGKLEDLWSLVKKYIHNFFLFVISKNDLFNLSKLENLETNLSTELLLINFCKKFNVQRCVICIKEMRNRFQIRYSLLYSNNKIYKSLSRKQNPIENIGGGDSFIGCLISQYIENKTFELDMLDKADFYTINNQNSRGNFSINI